MACPSSTSCLIPELTAECTNACLVVACDDPNHDPQPCDGTCNDFLQCCLTPDPVDWYADLPCDCLDMQAFIADPPTTAPSPPLAPLLSPSFSCMWADCRAVFGSLSDLIGHVNLHHLCPTDVQPILPLQSQDKPPLSCHWGDCAMFPSSSSIPTTSSASDDHILGLLTTHFMQDHLGLFPPSTCPSDLHDPIHSPSATPNPPSHDCSGTHVCKWQGCCHTFPSCDDLTAHIAAVHVGGGKAHYDCFWEGCHRNGTNGFSSKQKISRHLQSHTGHRPFQCQVCNQCFSEAATLQQHMRRHTQEKPYVCDFPGCGKAFAITGALTIHKRIHNGLRPFKCKFCDKAFSESSNLTKHLRTHTGARPYICAEPGCEKAFARPDQLARHMNVHRKKDPKT